MALPFVLSTDRDAITCREFSDLMAAVGWGSGYDEALFLRSVRAYTLVGHARGGDGTLLGYVSAFSDGAYSTMLGELVVRPEAQGHGVGRALLALVETGFPGVPIYVKALGDARRFFESCGYRVPGAEMTVLFKRP